MWEIIGFEQTVGEDGQVKSYTIYCRKPNTAENAVGDTCKRFWYPARLNYVPKCGAKVFVSCEVRGSAGKQYEAVAEIMEVK